MPTPSCRRWLFLLAALSLTLTTACRPYRLPSPQGPPQPKKVKASASDSTGTASAAPKGQHNSYDKNGLLKKKKYERRRLKRKVGQRMIFGHPLPFQ